MIGAQRKRRKNEMGWNRNPKKRRGITGLETAIILVAFVISAAAFSFIILNMGFLTAQKSQSVVTSGMQDATSSLQSDSDVIGTFNVTQERMLTTTFYLRLSQGREPVDSSKDKLIITYSNPRTFGVIRDNTTAAADITQVIGDNDKLIEYGERWKVSVNYTLVEAALGTVKAYGTSYDTFRLEIRPAQGSVLSIRRTIPPINSDVMILE